MKRLITTECVSVGHPDKIADFISDSILDAYLDKDIQSKVAVETMVKDNMVILGGEVTSSGEINVEQVVREAVKKIGYTKKQGFHYSDIKIINLIGKQSQQINSAVDKEDGEIGAGDQGFMTGFASADTDNYMPLGMYIARALINCVSNIHGCGPDIKTQVTIEEDNDKKRVHTILISTMVDETWTLEQVQNYLKDNIINRALGLNISNEVFFLIDNKTKIVINPAGHWTKGGPVADCGITGRKIVVDQYGPYCPVGGGAFSGKCYTKQDRTGAYLCRHIAKNIVANGYASECKVEIAYMIGVAEPVSISLITKNATKSNGELLNLVKDKFPLKPIDIIKYFNLTNVNYSTLSMKGHFGEHHSNAPWERIIKI